MAPAATLKSAGVFMAWIMTGVADVALSVPCLVCMKVAECRLTAAWQRAMIAIARIEAVIHVSVESTRAVEPGTCSYENAANKPIRAIVPIGRAVIGSIVEVPVGADRG